VELYILCILSLQGAYCMCCSVDLCTICILLPASGVLHVLLL
jgi:hypothetical protein